MRQSSIHELLCSEPGDPIVTARAWIRTKRDSKNVLFFELNDGSCMSSLQAVVDRASGVVDEELNRNLLTGASVEVEGRLTASSGGKQDLELQTTAIRILGKAPDDYPLQKKRHSFEYLREIAHLRPRTNTFGAVARVRNVLAAAIHEFFQSRNYLWINTPIITGSDVEGAGNLFQVTTLNLNTPPMEKNGGVDYGRDFFGAKAHLTVSGQLQAESHACCLSRVYTFGPTFRAENSNTTRHLSEFWMVEPETAFCDLDCNRLLAEEFIKYLLEHILTHCEEDMMFFDKWIQNGLKDDLKRVMESPFAHMTYTEALAELKKADRDWESQPSWGENLQAEHEKYLSEAVVGGPVTVTDYPKAIKPFYMKQNEDGKTVRGMDVLVPRLGEIIGGSQREDDTDTLETAMNSKGMNPVEYDWYLDLRRYGTVPHSGFGLGFERLLQYITGMQNIRDVIPFPRAPRTIDF